MTFFPDAPPFCMVPMMVFDWCSRNGELIPVSEAAIPLSSIEYTYGFGVYETIRVSHGVALFLEQHIERLLASATCIGLEHQLTKASIEKWIRELLVKIDADACNSKILLIGGRTPELVTLWITPLAPLFPDKKLYRDGAKVLTVHHERFLPNAKTLNMLPSYLFYRQAKNAGCYDALLINRDGCITEGTRTNILAMKGKTIISPPKEEILEGVMRANVLAVAEKHGFSVVEKPIPVSAVSEYDSFFLTSTSSKIMPIQRIDQTPLRISEPLRELQKYVEEFLDALS